MPQPGSRRKMTALPSSACRKSLWGLLRLLELPAVGEELLHVHAPVGNELGAFGLALLRELRSCGIASWAVGV